MNLKVTPAIMPCDRKSITMHHVEQVHLPHTWATKIRLGQKSFLYIAKQLLQDVWLGNESHGRVHKLRQDHTLRMFQLHNFFRNTSAY